MMISSLGAGYAIVPVPPVPDWNVSSGGGPIRRSSQASVPAHAGNWVHRTPLLVVREAEAGATYPEDLSKKMFLPDGRLVPAAAYAYQQIDAMAFAGADGPQPIVVQPSRRGIKPAFVSMLLGAGAGAGLVREHRIAGAVGGAIVGGILGAIFG